MRSSKAVAGLAMALLLAGGRAAAEEAEKPANPWAGSSLVYEHTFSAISLNKSAEQTWNPYYAHSLSLQPAWKFHPFFDLKARLDVEQELTNSEDTTKLYEWMLSDLLLSVGAGDGYTEPTSGITAKGGVRFTLPTSKLSHARTLILGVGPGAALSRKFAVLGGLTVGYNGRFTLNFNEETTARYDASPIAINAANSPDSPRAAGLLNTGLRNAQTDFRHGATADLAINDKLTFSTSFTFLRNGLYDVEPGYEIELTDGQRVTVGGSDANDVQVRHSQWFIAEVAYQAVDFLGVSLGVSSLYLDLANDGTYQTPFINRFTNVYMDLSLDIDAAVNRFN